MRNLVCRNTIRSCVSFSAVIYICPGHSSGLDWNLVQIQTHRDKIAIYYYITPLLEENVVNFNSKAGSAKLDEKQASRAISKSLI